MANDDYQPLKISDIVNSCRTGHQVGTGVVNFINMLPLALFGWLSLFSNAVSIWGTPFIRGSIGLRYLIVSGLIGVLLHQMITIAYINSAASFLLVIWTGLLLVVWLCHIVSRAERAIYNPMAPPIHSRCMGSPLRFMYRLWHPLLRGWSDLPIRIALVGEPLLFLALAVIFAILEPIVAVIRDGESLGIWKVPFLTAVAIWIQAVHVYLAEKRYLAMLSDQEIEQLRLAEAMASRPNPGYERTPEGYAVVEGDDHWEEGAQ
ncbi:MAG: hypothetical protein RLN60_03305 [Phycisphaerales bacterium]